MNTTLLSTVKINEPISSVYEPLTSIVPERLRSITMPIDFPIVGEELSSATEPVDVDENEEIVSN